MRVRYIGDARTIVGFGMPIAGTVYDWPDDMAASLIEQGKAELVVDPPPAPRIVPKPQPTRLGAGKE